MAGRRNQRYCVGSPQSLCFPFSDPESRADARAAALRNAKRGEKILVCSHIELRGKRHRFRDVCHVESHKQPTDLALALLGVGALVLAGSKK